jgi:hypothetical protein
MLLSWATNTAGQRVSRDNSNMCDGRLNQEVYGNQQSNICIFWGEIYTQGEGVQQELVKF